jgi:hypothetical protein
MTDDAETLSTLEALVLTLLADGPRTVEELADMEECGAARRTAPAKTGSRRGVKAAA